MMMTINGYERVVYKLVDRRKQLGLTQDMLAYDIGCTRTLISNWERFKRQPSPFMLGCWVEALGLQIEVTEKREESEA